MTRSLPPGSSATGAGVGAGGLYAIACGFIPDPSLRSLFLGASPGVGLFVRLICMRLTHRIVVRDAKKSYEAVLEAIEIEKRRGASEETLLEMNATEKMARLRYFTLLGRVSGADETIEKISKGKEP